MLKLNDITLIHIKHNPVATVRYRLRLARLDYSQRTPVPFIQTKHPPGRRLHCLE